MQSIETTELNTEAASGQPGQPRQTFLFHIGTPKTGTSSIQVALLRLSDELTARGVTVPYDRTIYVSGKDAKNPTGTPPQFDGLCYFFDIPEELPNQALDWAQEVSAFLADENAHTFVLSHESMSQQVARLRAELLVPLAAQADIRFLVYLRSPLSYLSSYCVQSIKGIGPEIPRRRQDMGCITRYLKGGYAGFLIPFEKYGQVDARNFDRLRLAGRLVPDFFEALGVTDLGPQIDALKDQNAAKFRLNETCVFMALKRGAVRSYRDWIAMRNIINSVSMLLEPPTATLFLPASLGAKITARWDEDREVLYQRYGVSFDAPPDFKPGPEVLSFSAEYAAALQEAAAPKLSRDQQEWLTGALALADLDLEEALPGEVQKAGQKKALPKSPEQKPAKGDVPMKEDISKKPEIAHEETMALARALHWVQNRGDGAAAPDSGQTLFKDVREEFMPRARRALRHLQNQGYSLTKS